MFEEMLNSQVREFLNRANDKQERWKNNIVVVDEYFVYYIEYMQERLYWVYDYNSQVITMIYASSPSEAIRHNHLLRGREK